MKDDTKLGLTVGITLGLIIILTIVLGNYNEALYDQRTNHCKLNGYDGYKYNSNSEMVCYKNGAWDNLTGEFSITLHQYGGEQ